MGIFCWDTKSQMEALVNELKKVCMEKRFSIETRGKAVDAFKRILDMFHHVSFSYRNFQSGAIYIRYLIKASDILDQKFNIYRMANEIFEDDVIENYEEVLDIIVGRMLDKKSMLQLEGKIDKLKGPATDIAKYIIKYNKVVRTQYLSLKAFIDKYKTQYYWIARMKMWCQYAGEDTMAVYNLATKDLYDLEERIKIEKYIEFFTGDEKDNYYTLFCECMTQYEVETTTQNFIENERDFTLVDVYTEVINSFIYELDDARSQYIYAKEFHKALQIEIFAIMYNLRCLTLNQEACVLILNKVLQMHGGLELELVKLIRSYLTNPNMKIRGDLKRLLDGYNYKVSYDFKFAYCNFEDERQNIMSMYMNKTKNLKDLKFISNVKEYSKQCS